MSSEAIQISNCASSFSNRMEEITNLIALMPTPPTSENVKQRQAITRSAIVLLCGHFEGFLQELMEDYIEEINRANIPFKELPPELYVQQKTKGKINYNNIDPLISFTQDFKNLINSNISITLSKDNFNKTDSNPTADLVNKLFRLMGYTNIIDELNREVLGLDIRRSKYKVLTDDQKRDLISQVNQPEFVEYVLDFISNTKQGKVERNHGFYNTINQLLKLRNDVAHGGQLQISDHEIIELKDKIEQLVNNLISKANVSLALLIIES